MRFAVITPTVGRDCLRSALMSVKWQTFPNLVHIVVADGPQQPYVRSWCEEAGAKYYELATGGGCFGAQARNKGMEIVENGALADYLLFLDDDNILFPTALERYEKAARQHGDPPLIYQEVLFHNQFNEHWMVLPLAMPPEKAKWDSLNACYRSDVVRGARWDCDYNHDFNLSQQAIGKAGTDQFVKAEGLVGVHF